MPLTRDFAFLIALTAVGAAMLLLYAGLMWAVFRCEKLGKRQRWLGVVIPGLAVPLAYYTQRHKRATLFLLLAIAYAVLRFLA